MWPPPVVKDKLFKSLSVKAFFGPILLVFIALNGIAQNKNILLNNQLLLDKIKGGWAGQLIGCALGGPYEHKFQSTLIPENIAFSWSPDKLLLLFKNNPELFDDLFLDMLFVETLEKKGLNASAKDLGKALSRAPFLLHHGLQMAKHNFLIGLKPPRTGHWLNNPHADDNDFQKVADFIGLISPGILPSVIKLGNRLGHLIASGDGYYGGIYIASLYSLAFLYENPERMVEEALKIFPAKANFTRVIQDVVDNYHRFPNNWQQNWQLIQKKWGEDIGCPEGVFKPSNFEAKINAAWITIGLLYGRGDFGRTLEITLRCGDDTDSNAASAGGLVGTILGFSKIPSPWKKGMKEVEFLKPKGMDISISEATDLSFKLALETIKKNKGKIENDKIFIPRPRFSSVPYEANFTNHSPSERRKLDLRLTEINSETTIEFEGSGFVINGRIIKKGPEDHTYRVAIVIDGRLARVAVLPAHPLLRNPTPFFHFNLKPGNHRLFLQISEPSPKADIQLDELIIYKKSLFK
ncbi:MAG: ADP-ribosylglycohydrolase family protein [Candidatus Aminicenantes bacterium]|nr:ADP-ribosylglycohydrolase family protein [Candidatus Aminicenantes bacterium]